MTVRVVCRAVSAGGSFLSIRSGLPVQALLSLGCGPTFVCQLSVEELEESRVGRVVFESHGHVTLASPEGELRAILAPQVRDRYDRIVVGDWVVWTRGDPVVVQRRLERQSMIRRRDPGGGTQVIAANVDVALLCLPADEPVNVRRLERWLAVANDADVELVVVLTRSDLGDPEVARAEIANIADLRTVPVSAIADRGREALMEVIEPRKTAVLLGQSGVGKSTLTNWLLDRSVQSTGGIRDDGRGRHTTTARQLFGLANGGWLLDNPGVRSVGLLDESALSSVFAEVDALVERCRFRDCHHDAEPGCAVQQGLIEGALDPDRLAAWRKLQREIAYEARREDPALQRAERDRWKQRHLEQRRRYKAKE